MRKKFPPFVGVVLLGLSWICEGARTTSVTVGSSNVGVDKEGGTHRQYSHQLDSGSSISYGSNNKPVVNLGSGEGARNGNNNYETKGFAQSGGSSVEYGGVAEGTGSFHSLFPSPSSGYPSAASSGGYPSAPTSSSSGGYPSPSVPSASGQLPPLDASQPNGPAYTYYYQHYPQGSIQGGQAGGAGGWSGASVEGHEEGGVGGGFGDLGGGGAGLGGLGGLVALPIAKGVAIIAKGILAIKPFLILGLLLLVAIPVLLLFLPIPIITVTGTTAMTPGARRSTDPTLISYLSQLSERVLTSEECLERFLCKMPKAPESYQKKAKSLYDTYGSSFIKNQRLSKGLSAYFDSAEKNRGFKCNQRFQCSNKFL